jgi:hypothetical protein
MAQGRGAATKAGSAEVRKPPSWYDGGAAYDAPLPGLPDFVTVAWIETWTVIVASHMRRLHERMEQRPKEFPWWPRTRPGVDDLGYLVAMAMQRPGAFALMTRDHALNNLRAKVLPGSLFKAGLRVACEIERAVFVEVMEDPDAALLTLRAQLKKPAFRDRLAASPGMAPFMEWLRGTHPEHAALIDGAIAAPVPDAPSIAETTEMLETPETRAEPEAPSDLPVATVAIAPIAPADPDADPEVERSVREFQSLLRDVRDVLDAGLASGRAGREVVRPAFLALRDAGRAGRRHDALLAAPVGIDAVLATMQDAVVRVVRAQPGKAPEWTPEAGGGVPRTRFAALARQAEELQALALRVETGVEAAQAMAEEMARSRDFSRAAGITAIEKELSAHTVRLKESLAETTALIAEARSEALAARIAAAIRPTAPVRAPAEVPLTSPVPAPVPSARVQSAHSCSVAFRLVQSDEGFLGVVGTCLAWIATKVGDLPEEAAGGAPFSAARGVSSVRTAASPSGKGRFWGALLRQQDGASPDRTWTVEVCVGEDESGGIRFGARTSLVSPDGSLHGQRDLPRVVREILDAHTAADASRPLSDVACDYLGEAGAASFRELVFHQGRRLPVLAISASGGATAAEVEEAARRLAGAAHVVTLDAGAASSVAATLGSGWSLQPGSAQLYPPGADPESAGPGNPAIRRDRIRGAAGGASGFARLVADLVLRDTETLFADEGILDFEACLDRASALGRSAADAEGEAAGVIPREFVERHREEVERLRRDKEDIAELLHSVGDDIRQAEDENIEAWARNAALASEVERLRRALGNAKAPLPADKPKNVEEICAFAETGLGAGVVALPKAVRETRGTRNVNVERLYECLVFLRDFYVPMRRGEIEWKAYERALAMRRFEEGSCFAQKGTSQSFLGYTAHWKGRKVELDRHLKWGVGATDTMIRVYFHYDEAEQVAVIGHMPGHLDNFLTN